MDPLPIRSQHSWREYSGPETLTPSPHGQASSIRLVSKVSRFFQPEDKIYVCKVIPCGNERNAKYMRREYEILRQLNHPNIIGYEDFQYQQFNAFLYLEYCFEGDLAAFLPSHGRSTRRLTLNQAVYVIQQISSALVYLHFGLLIDVDANGTLGDPEFVDARNDLGSGKCHVIVHRDVKPQNVFVCFMVAGYMKVKLGDFGLARSWEEGASMSYVGTRAYLAPECRRVKNRIQQTPKSDIWAFGKTMLELTTHLENNVKLIEILESCLNEDPERRPSSLQLLERTSKELIDATSLPLIHRSILKERDLEYVDMDLISRFLDAGLELSSTASNGETSLHLVVNLRGYGAKTREELLCLFLQRGTDKDSQDANGYTPLALAARDGDEGLVQLLLDRGSNPNIPNKDGKIPLQLAALNGHETISKALLDACPFPSPGALYKDEFEVLSLLLNGDINPAIRGTNGRGLLAQAALKGYAAVVGLLIAKDDVEPDVRDKLGQTSLSLAALNGHLGVTSLLLGTASVHADSRDDEGMTPLMLSALSGHKDIVKLLLQSGRANPNAKDKRGRTALSLASEPQLLAVSSVHEDIVMLLKGYKDVDEIPVHNN